MFEMYILQPLLVRAERQAEDEVEQGQRQGARTWGEWLADEQVYTVLLAAATAITAAGGVYLVYRSRYNRH